jgi:hypothetical protein
MIQTQVVDLDQQRLIEADAAREQLKLDGINDAVEGRKPASCEYEYLTGYWEGCSRVCESLSCELALLNGEASEVEALIEEF